MPPRVLSPLVVWSARGGHGATTVAEALRHFLGVLANGLDQSAATAPTASSALSHRCGECHVVDAGVFRGTGGADGTHVVVLRGPSVSGLRALKAEASSIDHLIVVREPWRRTTNDDVKEVLGIRVEAEIQFSERVSNMADAGLLLTRIDRLDEFKALGDWARRSECQPHLALSGWQQMARDTG